MLADCRSSDQAKRGSVSDAELTVQAMVAGDIDVEAMWNSHRPVKESLKSLYLYKRVSFSGIFDFAMYL